MQGGRGTPQIDIFDKVKGGYCCPTLSYFVLLYPVRLVTNKRFILKKREMRYISCLIQYRGANNLSSHLRPNIASAMTPRSSADLPLSSPSSFGRQARQTPSG